MEAGADPKGLSTELDELTGPVRDEDNRGGGSDDIGDVSWAVPTVTLRYPSNIPNLPGHNWVNGIAMATPLAHKGATAGVPPGPAGPRPARGAAASVPGAGGAADLRKLLFAAMVLLVAAVFYPVLGHQLLAWDDTTHVRENPYLQAPAFFWRSAYQGIYMPITFNIWCAINAVVGKAPWAYHLANLILHGLNTLLVFWCLRLSLRRVREVDLRAPAPPGRPARTSRWADLQADLPAAAGALLFALHPVQVEPVSWVTSLKDVASGSFALGALGLHLQGLPAGAGTHRRRLAALAALSFLAAMLCKAMALAALLMAAIFSRLLFARGLRRTAVELSPWALVAVPVLLMNLRSQARLTMFYSTPLPFRPLVALDALGFYLYKLLWPVQLLPAYGRSARLVIESGQIYWSFIPGVLFLVGVGLAVRRWPTLAAGALTFVAGFALVSGLIYFAAQENTTVYDRYLYLSMLGPALLLAVALDRARALGRWPLAAAGVLLVALGAKSAVQTRHWHDDVSLWSYNVAQAPESPVALINLGFAYSGRGRGAEALPLYERAVRLVPQDPEARNNLGAALAAEGTLEAAAAQFQAALEINPRNLAARFNLARYQLKRGDRAGGLQNLQHVLQQDPRHRDAAIELGVAYLEGGDLPRCVSWMREAVRRHPRDAEALTLLGVALARQGEVLQAVAHFREALRLDPRNAMARANLATALRDRRSSRPASDGPPPR